VTTNHFFEENEMPETMIPITVFLVFGACVIAFFYYGHRNRVSVMETVQKAIETGSELNPDLLTQMGAALNPRGRDLRRGVIFLALGLAGIVCSFFFAEAEVVSGIRAGSVFPLFVGAGFLLVWKLNDDEG
jgi:hypothetical protein